MKIGFVLDDGPDKPDGVQQYILTLGRWLEADGHEVRYLVGETKRTDLPGVYSLARNMHIKFNGNKMTIPLSASRRAIKTVLKSEQFDVLHIQVPYSPFFGSKVIAAAHPQTAVVGTFHILPYGRLSRFGTILLGKALRRTLKRFDAMISVSEPAREFAASTFNVASTVIPNAVDTARFRAKQEYKPNDGCSIVFLGRLVKRKGARQLLEALVLMRERGTLPENVTVDICGSGEQLDELRALVNASGLDGAVSLRGFVSDEEKIRYLQRADIAVFPSLSGESFGIVLIEAMVAGSGVVLGGNNPGYASVLGEIPETLFDPADIPAFASKLETMITDAELRRSLHARQQAHVGQYDAATVGKQVLEVYAACKSARGSR